MMGKKGQILERTGIFIVLFLMPYIIASGQDIESKTALDYAIETDTVLTEYSLEELEKYRHRYSREISRLENERRQLMNQGIRDAELFLTRKAGSRVGDKVMMRLAELYYERAQDEYQLEMQEFDRQFSLYERGELMEAPQIPDKDISHALNMYKTVVVKYPQSDLVDDAYYNIAFLFEEIGEMDSAFVYYSQIVDEFPNSPLLPDAYMQIGEYYFNPPRNELHTAISYYKKILVFRDSPRYDEALYRLGWSHYRLDEYSKAIAHFTLLADDVIATKPYDPFNKYSNPDLVDESIEYIGISFLEHGGPEEVVRYLEKIGGRDYGADILKRMGDAYMNEKEEYQNALLAFQKFLELYPLHPQAPSIQNRIVQSFRRLKDPANAYFAREDLFNTYKEGSEWWQVNEEEAVREQAYILTESALRDNISVLLSGGQETSDSLLYEQAVVESRKYLKAFPADSSAPLIHWNLALTLDSKLKKVDQAYAEYLQISNQYWDSKYQRFAAENAVALAREAALNAIATAEQQAEQNRKISISELREKSGTAEEKTFNFREKMRLQPTDLSPAEARLASAYDNYIKLFPHAKETPLFLANAGVLYYRHNQFKSALKYFNTLLRHFPGSEEVHQARYAIMESYFGKGDFHSSEIIARRIIFSNVSKSLKQKAKRRLAESIFLNAEILADEKKHLQAGNEYRRVVKENPESKFADLALFNAALEYDKAYDYMRAVETYQLLLTTFPESGYIYDAQNNLAFDYAELGDFSNAANTYERLAAIHPESEKARDALYNASLYYAKAADWRNAINVNQSFMTRFATDEAADDLAYEISGYYKNLGEYEKAQESFEGFIQNFPHSPRVVEALFRRGEYYRERGLGQNALVEYERAINTNKQLLELELERNDYFAAEAEYATAMVKFEDFNELLFTLPVTTLEKHKKRKRDLLLEIVQHLSNCTSYATFRLYEATFMIGVVYQNFAQTWATQEIPQMESTRRIVAQKEVNDVAIDLYERSAQSHRRTITALQKLSDSYRASIIQDALKDTLLAMTPDTAAIVAQDTVLPDIKKWVNRAKSKLSQVNYNMGELYLKSINAVMKAPVPDGLGDFPGLVYRKQVLDIAVDPLLDETFIAYENSMQDADSFQIDSQWTSLTQLKLVKSKNMIPNHYAKIAYDGLLMLEKKYKSYSDLIYSRQGFESIANDLRTSFDELFNLLEFSQKCQMDAVKGYLTTIQFSDSMGLDQAYVSNTQDTLLVSVLEYSLKCDTLSQDSKGRLNRVRDMYVKTQDPVYEEGLFTFDTNYHELRKMERDILTRGYEIIQERHIDNIYSNFLTLQMVRFDPEKYAGYMELEINERSITTDSTWTASPTYFNGWASFDFDDSFWRSADVVQKEQKYPSIWYYNYTTAGPQPNGDITDSTGIKMAKPVPRAYFRKSFFLKGLPVTCKIFVSVDQLYDLYFNGDHIDKKNESDSVRSSATYDVTDYLSRGRNLVAIEGVDLDGTANGVHLTITVKNLPEWDSKVNMYNPAIVNDEQREKLMLEKGRIP